MCACVYVCVYVPSGSGQMFLFLLEDLFLLLFVESSVFLHCIRGPPVGWLVVCLMWFGVPIVKPGLLCTSLCLL